jgi:hypothetical protein
MNRHALTAAQWAVIQPLLPQQKPGPGRRRAGDRRPLNGILHVLKTGCAWEDMPRAYGSPPAGWRPAKPVGRPQQAGVGPGLPGWPFWPGESRGHAVGTTTVGQGSKVMVAAEGQGLPIGRRVASAPPHASQRAEAALATSRAPRPRGRPRPRPQALVADKAHDGQAFRCYLRRRGMKPPMPPVARRRRQRHQRGRPIRTGPS